MALVPAGGQYRYRIARTGVGPERFRAIRDDHEDIHLRVQGQMVAGFRPAVIGYGTPVVLHNGFLLLTDRKKTA